jgi:L-proline amide hydrolase
MEGNKSNGTVIAIHGGPAFCHNYILPLILLVRDGYTVIFYDQAGCGLSTFVKDPELEAPWLLTIEYYIRELEEVIKFMNLKNYFLYGSSWVSYYQFLHILQTIPGYSFEGDSSLSRICSPTTERINGYDSRRRVE